MVKGNLSEKIETFRKFVLSKGWSVAEEKEIAYGYQLTITNGIEKTPVGLFPSGKVLVQGKPGTLQTEIKSWYYAQRTPISQLEMIPLAQQKVQDTQPQVPSTTRTAITGIARIGSGEAGKEDYFGPLVVAGMHVDKQSELRLAALQVRDSKLLPDILFFRLLKRSGKYVVVME